MLLDTTQIQLLMFQIQNEDWRKEKEDADTQKTNFFLLNNV